MAGSLPPEPRQGHPDTLIEGGLLSAGQRHLNSPGHIAKRTRAPQHTITHRQMEGKLGCPPRPLSYATTPPPGKHQHPRRNAATGFEIQFQSRHPLQRQSRLPPLPEECQMSPLRDCRIDFLIGKRGRKEEQVTEKQVIRAVTSRL